MVILIFMEVITLSNAYRLAPHLPLQCARGENKHHPSLSLWLRKSMPQLGAHVGPVLFLYKSISSPFQVFVSGIKLSTSFTFLSSPTQKYDYNYIFTFIIRIFDNCFVLFTFLDFFQRHSAVK